MKVLKRDAMNPVRPVARLTALLKAIADGAFEKLQRERSADFERALADAANPRELTQRVHRIESGELVVP